MTLQILSFKCVVRRLCSELPDTSRSKFSPCRYSPYAAKLPLVDISELFLGAIIISQLKHNMRVLEFLISRWRHQENASHAVVSYEFELLWRTFTLRCEHVENQEFATAQYGIKLTSEHQLLKLFGTVILDALCQSHLGIFNCAAV